MNWKDVLLPGGSRAPIPWKPGQPLLPGYAGDTYGEPVQRSDWVDAGGVPVISGSSEYWDWMNYGRRPGGNHGGGPNQATASFIQKYFPQINQGTANKQNTGDVAKMLSQQPDDLTPAERVLAQLLGLYY